MTLNWLCTGPEFCVLQVITYRDTESMGHPMGCSVEIDEDQDST